MDRVARAPGALKGGHFRNCQLFCRSWGGFVAKHQKIEGEKILFSGKKLTVPKKTERGTLWDFPTSILSQNSKKIQGGPFEEKKYPEKKSRSAEKKSWKGGPFGLAGYGILRGKTGKTLLVQFARPNSAIWCNNIL